ncbi:MAG TPA: ribose-phosphate pyrophosphokinase [Candidatus Aenigmarchaeota archaeon]|nr:ribose-phosphate pyrophosphokinase [Candidatus Aenigmarchaeota archaeon]
MEDGMKDYYEKLRKDFLIYSFMNMQLLATDGSLPFAQQVYTHLCKYVKEELGDGSFLEPLGHVRFERFACGEAIPRIQTNVRRSNVYVINQFLPELPEVIDSGPNEGLMRLYILDEALRNSSPAEINYILPFIPYLRQDRIDKPRAPISARRVLRMISDPESRIMARIVTFDLHAAQEQGFSSVMMDHLFSEPLYFQHFTQTEDPHCVTFVSPDAGGAKLAERYARAVGAQHTSIQKSSRYEINEADALGLANPEYVGGKKVKIPDDIVDTAGTVTKAADLVRKHGATSVEVYAPHPVLSVDKHGVHAEDKLRNAGVTLLTTDGLIRSPEYLEENKDVIRIVSLAPLVARAIYEIQKPHGSVSKLFEYRKDVIQ